MVAENVNVGGNDKGDLLKRCEENIKKGQTAFMTTARAVNTIRKEKLYKPDFKNASAYFAEKWDMTPADITRYTHAAEVLEFLESKGCKKLPQNEGQARALYEITNSERMLSIWEEVVKSNEKITAKMISQLANPVTLTTPKAADEEVTAKSPSANHKSSPSGDSLTLKVDSEHRACTAVIELELDSSVVMDAAEYCGIPCTKTGENLYSVMITKMDRASLFHHLASWEAVYSLKKVTITFQ